MSPQYTAHPAADLFPMLAEAELQALAEDIREHGLLHPVVMYEGQVLDGRNRLAACVLARVEPDFAEWSGAGDPWRWVVSTNLHRRHLTTSQRAEVGLELEEHFAVEAEARSRANLLQADEPDVAILRRRGRASEQAAAAVGVSPRTLQAAKSIATKAPELREHIRAGTLTIEQAKVLAPLPVEQRAEAVERVRNVPPKQRTKAARAELGLDKPHVAHNSGEFEWYTPAEYVDAAREAMGSIDLDPASCETANATVKAARYYTIEQDGLGHEWRGNVWLNPPYARGIVEAWADAVVQKRSEYEALCVIVNNATETRWLQAIMGIAAAACLPLGRVKFYSDREAQSTPLQGQIVLYVGNEPDRFVACFERFGACWRAA